MNRKRIILISFVTTAAIIGLVLYVPTLYHRPFTGLRLEGFQNVYHEGEQIKFVEVLSGFGVPPCGGPVTQIFSVDDPTKPVFSDRGGNDIGCLALDSPRSYTLYYPAENKPLSTVINKTGIYKLEISGWRVGMETAFEVVPKYASNENTSDNNSAIIDDMGYLDEVKKFTGQNADWKALVQDYGQAGQKAVVYYTPTKLYNNSLGTVPSPQYRTLKLIVRLGFSNNLPVPDNIELVCSVSSPDNKTKTDYFLFPHPELNMTFDDALQSDRCVGK